MSKCEKCGYDDRGVFDFAHYCISEQPAAIVPPVVPAPTIGEQVDTESVKLNNFLAMAKLWVKRDGGDMDKALAWMYSDAAIGEQVVGNVLTDEQIADCFEGSPVCLPAMDRQDQKEVINCVRALLATANAGKDAQP